jgi:protease-4
MKKIDEMIDRHALRRKLTMWRAIAFLVIMIGLASYYMKRHSIEKTLQFNNAHIARIKIEGVISYNQDMLDKIREIRENSYIKAVILHINSPGGTVVGGESFFYALSELNAKKPVIAFMNEVAASAAYMIALASDHIVAHRGTLTGSIGVLLQSQEVTELAEKLGIKLESFKSSPFKAAPSPVEKTTPEVEKAIQETIDDIYLTFTNMVRERRPMITNENMPLVISGRIFTGAQALDLGIVDQLGTESTALEWLQKDKNLSPYLKVYDYDLVEQPSRWEKIVSSIYNTFNSVSNLVEPLSHGKIFVSKYN